MKKKHVTIFTIGTNEEHMLRNSNRAKKRPLIQIRPLQRVHQQLSSGRDSSLVLRSTDFLRGRH